MMTPIAPSHFCRAIRECSHLVDGVLLDVSGQRESERSMPRASIGGALQ